MTTYNKYDLNKDGRVNQSDLDYLRRTISNGAGEDSMDLNGDGAIDDKDIQAFNGQVSVSVFGNTEYDEETNATKSTVSASRLKSVGKNLVELSHFHINKTLYGNDMSAPFELRDNPSRIAIITPITPNMEYRCSIDSSYKIVRVATSPSSLGIGVVANRDTIPSSSTILARDNDRAMMFTVERQDGETITHDDVINCKFQLEQVTVPTDPFPDDEYTRWIIKSYLNPEYKIKPKIFWRGYEPVYHEDINTLGKAVLEIQEKLKTYEPPSVQLPEQLPEDFDLSKFADENYLVDITAENKDIWTFSTSVASETFNTTRGLITDVEQVPYGIRFSTSYGMSYFVPYFLIDAYLSPSDIKLHSLLRGALGRSEDGFAVLSDKVKTVPYDFANQPVQFYPFVHFPHYGRTLAITKGVEGAEKSFVQALTVDEISGEYFEDPSAVMSLKSLGTLGVIIPLAEGVIIRSVTEDRFYLLVPEIVSKNGGNTLKKYIANEVEGVGTLLRLTDIWTAQFASLVDERALAFDLDRLDNFNLPINEMTSVNSFHFLLSQESNFGTVIFEPTCIDGTTIYLPSRGVETSYVANLENSSMRNHYNVVAQTSGTSTPRVTFLSDISASDTSASVLATIPPNWTKDTNIAIDSSGVSFTEAKSPEEGYEHQSHYRNYLGLKDMSVNFSIYVGSPDGKEVWKFEGHTNLVFSVAVDNDGYVYSASDDKTVRKIDSNGNEVWKFEGHTGNVLSVAVDSQGYVYSGSDDKTVRKIDSNGNEIWKFEGHTKNVSSVAVDNDGYVYSGSNDTTIRKIDPSGNEVWKFSGHIAEVNSVAVDNLGYIYSGANDATIRKIDPSGNEVWKFSGHTARVNGVAVDSQGYVYSCSRDKTVRKIDPEGNEIWKFEGHTDWVQSVAVDNLGYVYSGSDDKTVRKIDPNGNEVLKFTGHTGSVLSVAVDDNGYVYSGSSDKTVRKISPYGSLAGQSYPTMKWGQMYQIFRNAINNEALLPGVNFWESDKQSLKVLRVARSDSDIRNNLTFRVPDITNVGLQLPFAIKSTGTNEYQYAFLPLK